MSRTLRMFHLAVPEDDIYAFYERLGLPRDFVRKRKFGNAIEGAAWAAFSDGEIDILPDNRLRDRQISEIFGSQFTQSSIYRALEAERQRVEQTPTELSSAFEYLQLCWGESLAKRLAAHPDELDRLGFYSRIERSAVAFAPVMSDREQREDLSEEEHISPLHRIIEIEPGIRGAFAVQRQYDGQWASPLRSQPFSYWTIHRNDFHAQFLWAYLDAYGEYLFDFWRKRQNQINQAPLYISTNLSSYVEYGMSIGGRKDFGRRLRQDDRFVCSIGNPAAEINRMVVDLRERGANHEVVDLVLWTSPSVLRESKQNLVDTLSSARDILRPGGGVLVGVPLLQRPEDANLALKQVETTAENIFGRPYVRNYLVGNTDSMLHIPISYIFMRK